MQSHPLRITNPFYSILFDYFSEYDCSADFIENDLFVTELHSIEIFLKSQASYPGNLTEQDVHLRNINFTV